MRYCNKPKHPDYDRCQQFVRAIEVVSRTFGLSIAHEDVEGEFYIVGFDETSIENLYAARINTIPDLEHD